MRKPSYARQGTIFALALSVAVVFLAGACDGETSGGSEQATGISEPTAVVIATTTVARQGCAPSRPHEPGDFDETITSGGMGREYILHVPPSYRGDEATPLVLNLHGFSSNAREQAFYSGLPAKSDEAGFILVTPQGSGEPAFWNFLGLDEPDDLAFFGDLLDSLAWELCIDSSRVYVAGISNGAAMSVTLACRLSGRIAAIAPVAGVFFLPGCGDAHPVSVIAFHGDDDEVVPFEGGTIASGLPVPPTEESLASWAHHNGCGGEAQNERVTEHVRRVYYAGCDQGAEVELYVVEGGGHTWPDGALEAEFLGTTTREINATDLMWEFFEEHPMP